MNLPVTPEPAKIKPTLLVIDDEAGPRDALKVILRPFFNIQVAESATAAIDVLNSQPIDLITLDQKLPDRQGLDLLQDIKLHHASVEVIIITGYGSLKSAMEGIRHGAAGYLLKPFNVTELLSLVNQTL
jgi:DNA-binding NtrC family response regulator